MNGERKKQGRGRRMLCLTVPPELISFLDEFGWKLLKKSGCRRKLDRMQLVRALVRAFKEGRFDVSGIRTEDEFVKAILSQIKTKRAKRGNGKR